MAATTERRDYRLDGPEAARAVERGLANADWYLPDIDPATLKALMIRSNGRAARDLAIWLGLMIGCGALVIGLWPSWWAAPALFAYATLYGSSADPRWHECGHGTAFRNDRANSAVYYLASFMLLREPTLWRWSHVRHHSDTIVVGRDPEIVARRPPSMVTWLANFANLAAGPRLLAGTARHALGRIGPAEAGFIPASEHRRVAIEARVVLTVHLAMAAWSVAAATPLPLLMSTLASFYGAWLMLALGTTQHLGLAEDVLDHRLNTRTAYFNPVLRFLYLNMNYHIEHHLFPAVPYHRLPELHETIRHELPKPSPSFRAAFTEAVAAMRRQRSDPGHAIAGRVVPTGAGGQASEVAVRLVATRRAEDGGYLDVGPVDALAPGSVARVDDPDSGSTYAVYRLDDGRVAATDGICTHSRRTHLAGGLIVGTEIECPKHNGRFDIATGACTRAPVEQPLATHPITIVDGRIRLH